MVPFSIIKILQPGPLLFYKKQWSLEKKKVRENGQEVLVDDLTEVTSTPITKLQSLGQVRCYQIDCADLDEACWLHIIRQHLGLARVLKPAASSVGQSRYLTDDMVAFGLGGKWSLRRGEQLLLQDAPSLNFLIAQARRDLGENFIIGGSNGSATV